MDRHQLGKTDLRVTAVAFGTAPLGELFGPLDEASALRLVDEAIDLGINFIDSSRYYGSAEERLGKALTSSKRDRVVLSTKTGRYGFADFDYSRAGVRRGIEESLRLLRTDHVDILMLHDVEFVDLAQPFGEGVEELKRIRDEGKARFIGLSGYPIKTISRAIRELDLDVVLTYAKGCLLDNSIHDELKPIADARGVGLINAAAVALGLLTPGNWTIEIEHPATNQMREASARMRDLCADRGVDISFVANQYATQQSGCVTTLVGTRKVGHLKAAIDAATTPIDATLVDDLLALRPPAGQRQWISGLPENN
jgi:aryl-alcohol dehydrogenase-like predicted oxidoreductase